MSSPHTSMLPRLGGELSLQPLIASTMCTSNPLQRPSHHPLRQSRYSTRHDDDDDEDDVDYDGDYGNVIYHRRFGGALHDKDSDEEYYSPRVLSQAANRRDRPTLSMELKRATSATQAAQILLDKLSDLRAGKEIAPGQAPHRGHLHRVLNDCKLEGLVDLAIEVFETYASHDDLVKPGWEACDLMVKITSQENDLSKTVNVFSMLQSHGLVPDTDHYNALLRACVWNMKGPDVISLVLDGITSPNTTTYEILVDYHGRNTGNYDAVDLLMEEVKALSIPPSVGLYSSAIQCLARSTRKRESALKYLHEMLMHHMRPPMVVLTAVEDIRGIEKHLDHMFNVFQSTRGDSHSRWEYEWMIKTCTMMPPGKAFQAAQKYYRALTEPSRITHRYLMRCCAVDKDVSNLISLYAVYHNTLGHVRGVDTWLELLHGLLRCRRVGFALDVFECGAARGYKLSKRVYTEFLNAVDNKRRKEDLSNHMGTNVDKGKRGVPT